MLQDKSQQPIKKRFADAGHDLKAVITKTSSFDLDLLEILIDSITFQQLDMIMRTKIFIDGARVTDINILKDLRINALEHDQHFIGLPSLSPPQNLITLLNEYDNQALVNTGVYLDLEALAKKSFNNNENHTLKIGLIIPRSGLGANCGITIVNSPGLIDQGYKGELKIALANIGRSYNFFTNGARIAQVAILNADANPFNYTFEEDNDRGEDAFGSTGT